MDPTHMKPTLGVDVGTPLIGHAGSPRPPSPRIIQLVLEETTPASSGLSAIARYLALREDGSLIRLNVIGNTITESPLTDDRT